MENIRQRTAWSEFSWTRWGFVLAVVGVASVLEIWVAWHRSQYLPSSYFLPEYGWHSTVSWIASWPTVVGEAGCYVQLGWFWVGWAMRGRRRWPDWWALAGSLAFDLAAGLGILASSSWRSGLGTLPWMKEDRCH